MQNKLRIVFMGTPDFAVPSLSKLCEFHDVKAVFCQPDKINGRGNKINYCAVKEYALEHGILVYQPETLKNNACLDVLNEYKPELIVVAAYGKILPKYILDYPEFGCINVHGSLLPKYRGASPIQAAVLNGDEVTGISIMYMAEGLDCGDIIHQVKTQVGMYETAGELFDRMSVLGADALIDAIDMITDGTATRTPQNDSESSHVSMIDKSLGKLNFSMTSVQIKRLVYGLNPWPSAYLENKNGIIKIHRVEFGGETKFDCGKIVSVTKKGIEVACGDGKTLIITEIQRQGKKKMDAYSYSLGTRIEIGMSINSF